jgi:hypothetical protein
MAGVGASMGAHGELAGEGKGGGRGRGRGRRGLGAREAGAPRGGALGWLRAASLLLLCIVCVLCVR